MPNEQQHSPKEGCGEGRFDGRSLPMSFRATYRSGSVPAASSRTPTWSTDALRAGTSVAAELLMRDDIGILAVGRAADMIAMPGDPFDDITVTERVDFVMKGGVITKAER